MTIRAWTCLASALALSSLALAQPPASSLPTPPPAPLEGMDYDAPFFPNARHDPDIPTVETLLGFPVGSRAARHSEILECFRSWADASDRAILVPYAVSHEGRTLFYMVVTSPQNHERLDEIKEGLAALADPRDIDAAEANRLASTLPAVAWMAYSIHGDEMSGADAALAATYHLIADQTDETRRMLDELVVIVDPLMNPDGRDRWINQIQEHRGRAPMVDDQTLLHAGYWPWGRTNHYLFDLNRDWIFGVHPESRGRIAAVGEWHPVLFVDSHEMGPQDTYLFSPSRDPVNPNLPKRRLEWWDVFSRDQAAAFDAYGWRYYTGEWNEEWYPGYSSSWAGFRGAVGILYEQASISDQAVRRPEGRLLTYRESVHHQLVSTMANLRTLLEHHERLMREFLEERRESVSETGPLADRTFAVVPDGNAGRLAAFVDLMRLQGFEVHRATRSFSAPLATDRFGRRLEDHSFPAGTILVANRQPEGRLVSTMLEFDPRMPESFLERERRELLRKGRSLLYDTTAWNITMMQDLESFTLAMDLPDGAELYVAPAAVIGVSNPDADMGFVIDGRDDRSVAAASQLMDRDVQVRVADEQFTWAGKNFSRGSVVVTRSDNRRVDDLSGIVDDVARDLGLRAEGVDTGLGVGDDMPDIGGEHFDLLERPSIAIAARSGVSFYSFGFIWHAIDHALGARSSHLDADALSAADLRRYNVLILPQVWSSEGMDRHKDDLAAWVREGGTLIAVGSAAEMLASEDFGLLSSQTLDQALADLRPHEVAVLREHAGRTARVDVDDVWEHDAEDEIDYPWSEPEPLPDEEELRRRDHWKSLFMPQGVFLAARADDEHWLTFGAGDETGVLFGGSAGSALLLPGGGADAVVRFGLFEPDEEADEDNGNDAEGEHTDQETTERVGWSPLPEGHDMRLRMSGLLWPEAGARVASSAYLIRERVGKGQVILFASEPVFRGATLGARRLLLNAIVYGPGMGTAPRIELQP